MRNFKPNRAFFLFGGEEVAGAPNVNPVSSFTYSKTGLTVTFTDTSTDSDGTIVGWAWNFGDSNTSSSQNPSHTYTSEGTYTVTLTVTDNDGGTHQSQQSITVVYPSVRNIHVADTFNVNAQEVTVFTTDVQETDLILLIHAVDSVETINAPTYTSDDSDAGYGTAIESVSGDDTATIWAKEAEASDEGEHIEVTWGSIERAVLGMLLFKDHNGVDVSDITNFSGGGATTNPTSPSVTTTSDHCLIIYGLIVDDNNSGNFPFPTVSGAEIFLHTRNFGEGAGGVMLSLAFEKKASLGSTGAKTWTTTASRGAIGFTIAIKPGSKGGSSPSTSTGLTEMWDLEDETAYNSSDHDITLVNSPTFETGHIGDALQSYSATKYATTVYATSSALFPGTNDATICFWIQPDSVLDTGYESGVRGAISIGSNATSSPFASISYRPNIDSVLLLLSNGTTTRPQYINISLQDNTWQMWTFRIHRVGFMSIQVNNIYYGQRIISDLDGSDITPTVAGLRIGYSEGSQTSAALFDSLMLYIGRVLEYDKSLEIYNEGTGISSSDLP